MKLGPVPKTDKSNTVMSKKLDDDDMSQNCNAIVIFPTYDQLGAMWKPDSGHTVCNTYIFINSNLLSYKN